MRPVLRPAAWLAAAALLWPWAGWAQPATGTGADNARARIGLVLSSEETFPMVSGAVICQIQEFSRYTRSDFVGVVHGYGNARGDVLRDPYEPMNAARRFGREFFTRHTSDYQIDTVRSGRVWG